MITGNFIETVQALAEHHGYELSEANAGICILTKSHANGKITLTAWPKGTLLIQCGKRNRAFKKAKLRLSDKDLEELIIEPIGYTPKEYK